MIDPSGSIEWVNPSAANMLGWDRKKLRDRNYSECVQPDGHEVTFRRQNGSRFPVEYSRRPIRWGEGPSSTERSAKCPTRRPRCSTWWCRTPTASCGS